MSKDSDVLFKLKFDELFRERKHRAYGIAQMLIKKYRVEINPQILSEMLIDSETMSRQWRKILEETPELRGSDYNKGKELSQRYQIDNLGYEPQPFKKAFQSKLL